MSAYENNDCLPSDLDDYESDLDTTIAKPQGWKVAPISGFIDLTNLLQGQEELAKKRVTTEIFSGTIREHNTITRQEVMARHGPILAKIGRLSAYKNQRALLEAVLDIEEQEYHVLDRECLDRLGMFFQMYQPDRLGWVSAVTDKMTVDYYVDTPQELARPVSEELTLLPGRLQRVADFLREPDVSPRERVMASSLIQVEANRAAELVDMVCDLLNPESAQKGNVAPMDSRAFKALQETQERMDKTAASMDMTANSMAQQLQQLQEQQWQSREAMTVGARHWGDQANQVTDRLVDLSGEMKKTIDLADHDHQRILIELEEVIEAKNKLAAADATQASSPNNEAVQDLTPEATPNKRRRSRSVDLSDGDLPDYSKAFSSEHPSKRAKH